MKFSVVNVRRPSVFSILTWTCASRHSGVHFFDIGTSKSGPKLTCFVHFDFKMCFSPQWRALFRHRNFKKRSETDVFCTFLLQNARFATAPCIFLTSELTKVVQTRHVLCILTSECAFRHSGVHFFDRRTAKSASDLTCFVHFHFKMWFSPQRRAIFDFSPDHLTPHPPL